MQRKKLEWKNESSIPVFLFPLFQRNKKQHFFEKYPYTKEQPASLGIFFTKS